MDVMNNPDPAEGDKKIERSVQESYEKIAKEEQEHKDFEMKKAAIDEFEKMHRFGFVTNKDIELAVEGRVGKLLEAQTELTNQLTEMKKENMALREFVLRAKAQGLNSGKLEPEKGTPAEDSLTQFKSAWSQRAK